MNKEKSKGKIIVSVLVWCAIAVFVFLIVYKGQFSFYNLYKSKKVYQQAIVRNDDMQAQNEYLEKDITDMDNDPRVQLRSSAEIGYKKPDVQIIKKTRKRETQSDQIYFLFFTNYFLLKKQIPAPLGIFLSFKEYLLLIYIKRKFCQEVNNDGKKYRSQI